MKRRRDATEDARVKAVSIGNVVYTILGEENDYEGEIQGFFLGGVEEYFDSRSGKQLDPKKVREARAEEMDFVKRIRVYDEADLAECYEKTGAAPVSTKWVDGNKGTEEEQDIRCRWVARVFKPKGGKTGRIYLRPCRRSRRRNVCLGWRCR